MVATVSTGFYDGYCDYYSEITFDKYWHISLFQKWLDKHNFAICILPSKAIEENKIINDHAALAKFEFDRSIKYASLKVTGIRSAIREFIKKYWKEKRQLPIGTHEVSSVTVTFQDPANPSKMKSIESDS